MSKVLIVAEIGINFDGPMSQAYRLIHQANDCGADIAKFQLYSVDKLFPDHQIITQGRNWYEEVKKTELTKEQCFQLADRCREDGIEFMASAFDTERLGWLEEIGVTRHKIAYRTNREKKYIDEVLSTGKEVLISANDSPHYFPFSTSGPPLYQLVQDRVRWLYCIPEYPAPPEKLHLQAVPFGYYSGFSDHSIGIEAAMIAISRGARIVEKHFTLDKTDTSGPDHICSAEPHEMKKLVEFARKVEKIL